MPRKSGKRGPQAVHLAGGLEHVRIRREPRTRWRTLWLTRLLRTPAGIVLSDFLTQTNMAASPNDQNPRSVHPENQRRIATTWHVLEKKTGQ